MRKQKKIVVEIDNEGNCSVDGHGFVGTECGHFITEIEETIGKQTSQIDKPEYNQRCTTRNRNLQREER